MESDIFSRIAYDVVARIDAIAPGLLGFFPHAVAFLAIPFILTTIARVFVGSFPFLASVGLIIGLFIAGTIPTPDLSALGPIPRVWAIAICVALTAILPAALAKQLTHSREHQSRIIFLLYLLTGFLYVMNFSPDSGIPLVGLQYP